METYTFQLPGPIDQTSLDSPRTLVLVFGQPELGEIRDSLDEVGRMFPSSVVIGCSTSGQVLGDEIHDAGLVGLAVRFESTRITLASTDIAGPDDSERAGRRLAEQLADDDLRAVLVLSDGIVVNGTALVTGLSGVLGPSVSIAGGLAGDQARFEQTWVLAGDRLGSGLIAAVGLYGDRVRVSHGSRHGWEGFGPARKVTRSTQNKLFELDGRPALELYKSYLGKYSTDLPKAGLLFPLSLYSADRPEPIVRTLLAVDEAEQSMTFAGDVPVGSVAQLMRASQDQLIEGASDAALQCGLTASSAAGRLPLQHQHQHQYQQQHVALAVSCVGRRLVLGQRAEEELDVVCRGLHDVPLVGFYSNGEVSPSDGFSELHNQTMTLAVITEL